MLDAIAMLDGMLDMLDEDVRGKAYQERVSASFYSLCVDSPCWMACWICWMHVGWKPQSNMRGNALYDRVTGLVSLLYVGYVGLI